MRWLVVGAVTLVGCAEGAPAHLSRAAVPIKSACTATSRGAVGVGLDVRAGRRHSESQTLYVTNVSGEPRTLEIQRVVRLEGDCSADWARGTPLNFFEDRSGEVPVPMQLQPGQALQLRIGDQRVHATWECTKLGLAVWMKVGDERVCADAGAWISERDRELD